MKHSEFHRACAEQFGQAYASVILRDHWLSALRSTADEALEKGIDPKIVWLALCAEFDVPENLRYGRGLIEPAGGK